jgi:hypothetical protein
MVGMILSFRSGVGGKPTESGEENEWTEKSESSVLWLFLADGPS